MRRGAAGKRRPRRSIAVISPLLASGRPSAVLSGAVAAASRMGVRVLAIQTTGGGVAEPSGRPPEFALRTAWDLVSGFLVVMNAVDGAYLAELRSSGKPVVLAAAPEADAAEWPVVRADCRGGTRHAVAHLLEHGHRRIGFVGCLRDPESRRRYEAFRHALAAYGVALDEGLVVDATDTHREGGEAAVRTLLGAGMPATAVMAATAANASGLLNALAKAGLQPPRDLAIVAFNDLAPAASPGPALSTVRLNLEAVGRRAAAVLIGLLRGRPAPARRHHVATTFVARESCGCSAASALQVTAAVHGDLFSAPEERLRLRLHQLLGEPGAGANEEALDRAVRLLTAAPGTEGGGQDAGLRAAAASLRAVDPRWAAVPAVVDCLHAYRRELGPDPEGAGARGGEEMVTGLALELSRSIVDAEATAGAALRLEAARWFQLAMSLLGGSAGDPRSLSWLSHTQARAACLGVWSAEPAGESHKAHALRVAATYVRDPRASVELPPLMGVEAFPPRGLLEDLAWGPGELAVVLPVRTRGMDLGLLAMVTPVEADPGGGRDQLVETSALLSVAIEREVMVEWLRSQTEDLARAYKRERDLVAELRRSEEQLRHSAHHDALTGLPNRTLFLDRLTQALARAGRRPDGRVALLFLDLDGFKEVNDGLGHLAGDRLLVAVAERISQRLRRSDTAARLGGDEFAVLLEEVAGVEAVAAVAADLAARLAVPFELEGKTVTVTASVGRAVTASGLEGPDELLRSADIDMYAVKAARHAAETEVEVIAT